MTSNTIRKTISGAISSFDMFGLPPPSFNLKGHNQVSTCPGGLLSILIGIVTLLFALMKFQHLLERRNPTINTRIDSNGMFGGSFDLADPGFQMAFGLEGRWDHSILNNPRYVRWGARLWSADNGPYTQRPVKMHPCTDADFLRFYPPEPQAAQQVERYKNETGSLFCLDWNALKFELFGSADVSTHQSIDIEAQSCSTHTALFGKQTEDEEDCEDEKDLAVGYMNETAFVVLSNEGRFAPDNFIDPVKKFSKIRKHKIDEISAHWYDTFIQMNQIQDETSLVSWGQARDFEYHSIDIKEPKKSMFADWPNKYKFTGIELQFSSDLELTERSTYSLLEWLGDIGGLLDALKFIALSMIGPVANFVLSQELLTNLFRILPTMRNPEEDRSTNLRTGQQVDDSKSFDHSKPIKAVSLLQGLCCSKSFKRQKKMIARTNYEVERQLDLVRFLAQIRRQTLGMLAISDRYQRLKIDKLASLIIHESSDLDSKEADSCNDGKNFANDWPMVFLQYKPSQQAFDRKLSFIESQKEKRQMEKRSNIIGKDKVSLFQTSKVADDTQILEIEASPHPSSLSPSYGFFDSRWKANSKMSRVRRQLNRDKLLKNPALFKSNDFSSNQR